VGLEAFGAGYLAAQEDRFALRVDADAGSLVSSAAQLLRVSNFELLKLHIQQLVGSFFKHNKHCNLELSI
jgi:hypothetical protein